MPNFQFTWWQSLRNKFKRSRKSDGINEEVILRKLKYGRPGVRPRIISPMKKLVDAIPVNVSYSRSIFFLA